MAFGINKIELQAWKEQVSKGEIAFLTHYWLDPRFENATTVTKVGCTNLERLTNWGEKYGLKKEWIHNREKYPHFDLIGSSQIEILIAEGLESHIARFNMIHKKK
jgi:hypothetical protein